MPKVIFNGPEGRLEGRYSHSKASNSPMALLLHPHPKHGGAMNNKLIYALYQTFVRRGFSTLRFNFRGVGRSQGKFDSGHGEMSDAASALDWMQIQNPNTRFCLVAGFSFGAWIGMQLVMRRPEINRFISVAPPASIYDFSFLAPCPASGLILHGDKDDVVPISAVEKLVRKVSSQKNITIDYRVIKNGDHFLLGHLPILCKHVDEYLAKTISQAAA